MDLRALERRLAAVAMGVEVLEAGGAARTRGLGGVFGWGFGVYGLKREASRNTLNTTRGKKRTHPSGRIWKKYRGCMYWMGRENTSKGRTFNREPPQRWWT